MFTTGIVNAQRRCRQSLAYDTCTRYMYGRCPHTTSYCPRIQLSVCITLLHHTLSVFVYTAKLYPYFLCLFVYYVIFLHLNISHCVSTKIHNISCLCLIFNTCSQPLAIGADDPFTMPTAIFDIKINLYNQINIMI